MYRNIHLLNNYPFLSENLGEHYESEYNYFG